MSAKPLITVLMLAVLGAACIPAAVAEDAGGVWVPLFNGKDLEGWTPKIVGYPLGENYGNTFRVEDGVIKVSYDQYKAFDDKFGHLFYTTPFTDYRLRVEYRFTGKQVKGGPGWAFRNSGVMIQGQDPKTMRQDQDFPVSIEVQLLGGEGSGERHTVNLCTPGTNVVMNGALHTAHCTDSISKTYHGDQWVTVEIEVRDGKITHLIDGEPVLSYSEPQLDPSDKDAKAMLDAGAPKILTGGAISLQSESHPVEFRKVEIMELKE